MVLFANGGAEKTKLGWLSDYETKFPVGNCGFSSFFHTEGNNAKGFDRRLHTGYSRHGALNSDVVRARCATADTYTTATTRSAVISCPTCHCEFEIRRLEDMLLPESIKPFLLQPTIQNFDHSVAKQPRFHNSTVEQDVRGTGQSTAAGSDRCRFRAATDLFRQKPREVFGDGRICCIWQAQFLETDSALSCWHLIAWHLGEKTFDENSVEIVSTIVPSLSCRRSASSPSPGG